MLSKLIWALTLNCITNIAASASPIPAPGPAALAPTKSPRSSQRPKSPPSPSPEAANVPQPFTPFGPVADTTPGNPNTGLTPPSPTDSFGNPDDNSGFKPNLTPSAAPSSDRFSTLVLLAACGAMALKFY